MESTSSCHRFRWGRIEAVFTTGIAVVIIDPLVGATMQALTIDYLALGLGHRLAGLDLGLLFLGELLECIGLGQSLLRRLGRNAQFFGHALDRINPLGGVAFSVTPLAAFDATLGEKLLEELAPLQRVEMSASQVGLITCSRFSCSFLNVRTTVGQSMPSFLAMASR